MHNYKTPTPRFRYVFFLFSTGNITYKNICAKMLGLFHKKAGTNDGTLPSAPLLTVEASKNPIAQ